MSYHVRCEDSRRKQPSKILERADCPCFCLLYGEKCDVCLSARVIFHHLTVRLLEKVKDIDGNIYALGLIICSNTFEALIFVLVSAEHRLRIFCRIVLFLLTVSSILHHTFCRFCALVLVTKCLWRVCGQETKADLFPLNSRPVRPNRKPTW